MLEFCVRGIADDGYVTAGVKLASSAAVTSFDGPPDVTLIVKVSVAFTHLKSYAYVPVAETVAIEPPAGVVTMPFEGLLLLTVTDVLSNVDPGDVMGFPAASPIVSVPVQSLPLHVSPEIAAVAATPSSVSVLRELFPATMT